MNIKKVRIVNFKRIKDLEITFSKMNTIVGNNECGKSTILEAIHLALTGMFRGKWIKQQLSQSLFNKEAVDEYLNSINLGKSESLPMIDIEIWFDDCPSFNGDLNKNREPGDGFSFYIRFNEQFKEYYQQLVMKGNITGLPIEVYEVVWVPFDRRGNFPNSRIIPIKSVLINADNISNSKTGILQYLGDMLSDDEKNKLIDSSRNVLANFEKCETIEAINKGFKLNDDLKNISIGSTNVKIDSWSAFVSANDNAIPLDYCGDGEQRIVKTQMAFANQIKNNEQIVLIEEPECHLSFSSLNLLMKLIEDISVNNQVIVTTHSSFVANRLNLNNLLLLSEKGITKLTDLDKDDVNFFKKRANYDTLRMALSRKTILVEGDSDDLIVEKAFLDKYKCLPIQKGIDVITVGLSGKRFLEIANPLKLNVVVVTDNDGNPDQVKEKYDCFSSCPNFKICYPKEINTEDYGDEYSSNTLEPEMVKANDLDKMNLALGKNFSTEKDLINYMEDNKTEWALKIFDYSDPSNSLSYPEYINEAIKCGEEK